MALDSTSGRRKYPRIKTEALFSIARVDSAGEPFAVDPHQVAARVIVDQCLVRLRKLDFSS